jgi:large subunit ribosomal protein L15
MKLHELQPVLGSKKDKRRVGRGHGSGRGKTSGRGTKGQNARTGGPVPPYFEGGQLPMVRRLSVRRGFTNLFRVAYAPVNLGRLAKFRAKTVVTPELLVKAGIIQSADLPVKILGHGEIDKPLRVKAHRFSANAKEKILAAGGSVEEIA